MKETEILKQYLDQFEYHYVEKFNYISVKLGYGLYANIELDEEKVRIEGYLKDYNPITGVFTTTLQRALVIQSFQWVIAFFIIEGINITKNTYFNFTHFLILSMVIMLLWNMYYFVRFYHFKSTVEILLFQSKANAKKEKI